VSRRLDCGHAFTLISNMVKISKRIFCLWICQVQKDYALQRQSVIVMFTALIRKLPVRHSGNSYASPLFYKLFQKLNLNFFSWSLISFFPFIVVLGQGTLWHLQMFLQNIKYIIFEFTPSSAPLYLWLLK
jgi:hypothetical protein